jgi:GNAT superfamily N-acetyltransferase
MCPPGDSAGHEVISLGSRRPPGLVELATERCPATEVAELEFALEAEHSDDFEIVLARSAGTMVGWGLRFQRLVMPRQWRGVRVFVRNDCEGRGVGAALHRALTTVDDVGQWRSVVFDDDERSLSIARKWGYDVQQHSITSRVDLRTARAPALPGDVTTEPSVDLAFSDAEAVEAMLDASQTKPERGQGLDIDLSFLRGMVGDGERLLAGLLRVAGRPAAITAGALSGEDAHFIYTGVDPAHRGRGLGSLLKQQVHVQAAAMGARWCWTDNEEGNTGIRHVNETLGYRRVYGRWWVVRPG